MQTIKTLVLALLENNPHVRNKDADLYQKVIHEYGYNPRDSFMNIVNLIDQKKLPSFESVRRTRQKIQEKFPLLRGTNYNMRKEAGEIVTQNIHKSDFLEQQDLF